MSKHTKKWFQTNNIYLYLLYKLGAALIGVLLAQLFFHYCANSLYDITGFSTWARLIWGNIVYSLAAVATVLLPYLIMMLLPFNFRWNRGYRICAEILYVIGVIFLIFAGCCDAAYFQHTYRLLSSEVFTYLTIGGQMDSLIPLFIRDYWAVCLAILICSGIFLLLAFNIQLTPRRSGIKHRANDIVGSLLGLAVTFILLRGGFHKDFISVHDTGRYGEPKYSSLIVNSGYNIIRTALAPKINTTTYLSDTEAQQHYSPDFTSLAHQGVINTDSTAWHYAAGQIPTNDTLNPIRYKNVVILLLESFSQEYMGCYNPKAPSFTPFLDSLAQHSFVYQGRSNGKKSIESIPAVTASIPTLMETPFILSPYFDNPFNALPQILHRYGFTSSFFHGGYNGTMNFDQYCKRAGFDEYLGQDEYINAGGSPDDYDGAWGIFDEPFLQYTARHLDTYREPFFTTIFTISSHHPFAIPEQYIDTFPKGRHPILECVAYSDHALRQFFKTASTMEWYPNTLFIITGDHPGYGFTPEFNDYDGWYRTPMIIYDPSANQPIRSNDIIQQIDLMPTLIDYWGLDEQCVCFGNSLFQRAPDQHGYQIVYGNGFYVLNYNGGPAIIEGTHTEIGDHDHLQLLKSIVQQYNQRLIQNKLH